MHARYYDAFGTAFCTGKSVFEKRKFNDFPISKTFLPIAFPRSYDGTVLCCKPSPMCSYKMLFYDDASGYVLYCGDCHRIQLGFGCVLVNFTREDFKDFVRMIEELMNNNNFEYTSTVKSIMVPSPCESITLYLSPSEGFRLQGMLDHADTSLKTQDLLQLF